MHYDRFEGVDWSRRSTYMRRKHGLTVEVADEALGDPNRVVIQPDYNSISGRSVRVIGYSMIAEAIVTVIVLEDDGAECGVNGWLANERDRRLYNEERSGTGGTDGQP